MYWVQTYKCFVLMAKCPPGREPLDDAQHTLLMCNNLYIARATMQNIGCALGFLVHIKISQFSHASTILQNLSVFIPL